MSITYAQASQIIETEISSNWAYTKVAYENVEPLDYSDPARPLLSDLQLPYIGIRVLFGESYAAEVGANAIKRSWGNIEVKFHSKVATGTRVNQDLMDKFGTLFEYKQIGGIVFKEIVTLTPTTVNGWYVSTILLRFYFNR